LDVGPSVHDAAIIDIIDAASAAARTNEQHEQHHIPEHVPPPG
jgi:hypothetical protein